MNQTINELFNRKSVRQFEKKEIEDNHKSTILEAAIQAPSAGNMSLYSIIDVTDQQLKNKLAVSCDNQPFIATAPMVLIFCADYSRWYNAFTEKVDEVRKPGAGDLFLAMEDTLIAAHNTVVAAESLGIGSCYIGDILENYELHKEILMLPKYVLPIAMLVYGYPTKQQQERVKPNRFKVSDILHTNTYKSMDTSCYVRALSDRTNKSNADTETFIKAMCERKWNCSFSKEMSRSVEAMLKDWIE